MKGFVLLLNLLINITLQFFLMSAASHASVGGEIAFLTTILVFVVPALNLITILASGFDLGHFFIYFLTGTLMSNLLIPLIIGLSEIEKSSSGFFGFMGMYLLILVTLNFLTFWAVCFLHSRRKRINLNKIKF